MQLNTSNLVPVLGWAALTGERYEEAVEFAIRAAESKPEFPDIYAARAATEGQLGRVDAGRSALDELLRRMPALTVGDERLNRPFAPRRGSRSLPHRFAQGRSARRMKSRRHDSRPVAHADPTERGHRCAVAGDQ
jgi:uncharacterized protein YfaP (DUF2135 family)